jgi:hypothetical protein
MVYGDLGTPEREKRRNACRAEAASKSREVTAMNKYKLSILFKALSGIKHQKI